jgi:transcriptional regulator with XRE-family HTH domain
MKDRILAFLTNENKSYAQFAEEIGVQPSGISHILSGRNNPSLDFVIKMLHRYPSLSAEWLLFGRGAMYKNITEPTLFEAEPLNTGSEELTEESDTKTVEEVNMSSEGKEKAYLSDIAPGMEDQGSKEKRLARVLMFYSDKTFTEYRPS